MLLGVHTVVLLMMISVQQLYLDDPEGIVDLIVLQLYLDDLEHIKDTSLYCIEA